uniref:Uncharacterized protein LOC104212733 n=1 Tax=Nicotiana sylvestris TaxID=4096 RepID=A0A1U7X601_NICSY|nr:PREDICTED: uncharacterized protein LOC104212733 [Nicotiana sylvestris]XP_009782314.1 PREDICTED: uncharacterized protein LOC104231078 [Nicotiana sylvestris]
MFNVDFRRIIMLERFVLCSSTLFVFIDLTFKENFGFAVGNATYDSLLGSNKPFSKPIPLVYKGCTQKLPSNEHATSSIDKHVIAHNRTSGRTNLWSKLSLILSAFLAVVIVSNGIDERQNFFNTILGNDANFEIGILQKSCMMLSTYVDVSSS